jgi:hypothetical protein
MKRHISDFTRFSMNEAEQLSLDLFSQEASEKFDLPERFEKFPFVYALFSVRRGKEEIAMASDDAHEFIDSISYAVESIFLQAFDASRVAAYSNTTEPEKLRSNQQKAKSIIKNGYMKIISLDELLELVGDKEFEYFLKNGDLMRQLLDL